jgi:hypothetical protein
MEAEWPRPCGARFTTARSARCAGGCGHHHIADIAVIEKTKSTLSRGMVRVFPAGEGLAGNAIHIGNERDQIGDNLELLA